MSEEPELTGPRTAIAGLRHALLPGTTGELEPDDLCPLYMTEPATHARPERLHPAVQHSPGNGPRATSQHGGPAPGSGLSQPLIEDILNSHNWPQTFGRTSKYSAFGLLTFWNTSRAA
jgi:hypothetical protein